MLCEYGYTDNEEMRAAAWLHDILEDTGCGVIDMHAAGIPAYVLALVDAVTDRSGANRKERHALTYPRIARIPDAVTLKLADRIANVRASIARRPDLLKMYQREHEEFMRGLQREIRNIPMWIELGKLLKASHA